MTLSSVVILTVLIFPFQERGIPFHDLESSCFLFQCFMAISIQISYHLGQSLFLDIFDAILNKFLFFVTFYDLSLLVYRNSTDFWILIRYSATLLSSFIISSVFVWSLLGFLYRVSCHLHIGIILPLPTQFEYIFSSFSHLITVALYYLIDLTYFLFLIFFLSALVIGWFPLFQSITRKKLSSKYLFKVIEESHT